MGLDPEKAARSGLLDRADVCVCGLPSVVPPCMHCRAADPAGGIRPELQAEIRRRNAAMASTMPSAGSAPKRARASKPDGKKRDDPEHREQIALVERLAAAGIPHAASLNGVKLTRGQAGKAKAAGMAAGEPDLRIDGHPLRPDGPDLALAVAHLRAAAQGMRGVAGGELSARLDAVARWMEAGAPSAVFVEMKAPAVKRKSTADRWAGATGEQRGRMDALREVSGAHSIVAYGAEDALAKLRALGFDIEGRSE